MYYETYGQYGLNLAQRAIAEHTDEVRCFAGTTAARSTYGQPLGLRESLEHTLTLRGLRDKTAYLLRAQRKWLALKHADDPDGDWDDFEEIADSLAEDEALDQPITFPPNQVQAKYKHAEKYLGFPPYSKQNGNIYENFLRSFINNPQTERSLGTWRGEPMVHYLNHETKFNAIVTPDGKFRTAFRLDSEQLRRWPDVKGATYYELAR